MTSYHALSEIFSIGIVFFTGFLLSLLFTPLSSRFAAALNLIDVPNGRSVHASSIPKTGGIAIALSFFLTIVLTVKYSGLLPAILVGGIIICLVGFIDDRWRLSAVQKLFGQIVSVMVFMRIGNISLSGFGDLLAIGEIQFGGFCYFMTLFGMVGVINAFNLSDGLDGLASGIGLIASLFLAILAFEYSQWHILLILIALAGVIFGFLRFNTHPAKLFMGDTGSLLIGFVIAAACVELTECTGIGLSVKPITVAYMVSLPIIDTLYVMGNRAIKKMRPFYPDKTHIHHRLMNLGLSHGTTVIFIYILVVFFCLTGWSFRSHTEFFQFILGISLMGAFYFTIHCLEKNKFKFSKLNIDWNTNLLLSQYKILAHKGRSVQIVRPLFICLFFIPLIILAPAPKIIGLGALAAAFLFGMLFPWNGGKQSIPVANGIMFIGVFLILIFYHFNPGSPPWMDVYLNCISVFGFCWVTMRMLFKRYHGILFPSGFELLLIGFSWFIPVVIGQILELSHENRIKLMWVCLQAIPIIALVKMCIFTQGRQYNSMALWVFMSFLIVGVTAFL